ncbi:hypothetical protein [Streptomyces sp. NPDC002215]|uniref:hypothetical protein n=1 Tax=Streptomyces sp. NPDC002215 TaxID=3154412 RepID=UPI00331C8847
MGAGPRIDHLLLDVEHIEPSLRPELRGDVQRLQSGPWADLQDPLPRPRPQYGVHPVGGQERQRHVEQAALGVRIGRRVAQPPGGGQRGARAGGSGPGSGRRGWW